MTLVSTGQNIKKLTPTETVWEKHISLERSISKLSIGLINPTIGNFNKQIDKILAEVGTYFEVDRITIFLIDSYHQYIWVNNVWCDAGLSPNDIQHKNFSIRPSDLWFSKLEKNEIVHITDVHAHQREAMFCEEGQQLQEFKSLIRIPFFDEDIFIGFISINSKSLNTWLNDDIAVLHLIGGIIGRAFAQKRKHDALVSRKEYLEKLNQITLDTLNANNTQEMLENISQQIGDLFMADYCSIELWDEDQGKVCLSTSYGKLDSDIYDLLNHPTELSFTEAILAEEKPLFVENNFKASIVKQAEGEISSTSSLLGIPMVAEGKKLGSILLGFDTPYNFGKDVIHVANQVACQISRALLKVQSLEHAQKTAQQAETLRKASSILVSTMTHEDALERILDQLAQTVPFDQASVQILCDGNLEVKARRGTQSIRNDISCLLKYPGDNPNTQVIQRCKPIAINDPQNDYQVFTSPHHIITRSWLGVPLIAQNRVIGTLSLEHHQPGFYDEDTIINLVTALADQMAISLENARLYAEEHQKVIELEALRATTANITQELNLERLIISILTRATTLLKATGGELGLLDHHKKNLRILVSHNMGLDNGGKIIKLGQGLMGLVAVSRKVEMVEDYQKWVGRLKSYEDIQIHAAIAAPLMIGDRFLGAIGIMNSDHSRQFSQTEINLMTLFAQQSAIAVENAQLFTEKNHQARIDITTGIYNRRGLIDLGKREIDRADRFNRPLSVIMIDIDNFKIINDTYGHATGDKVLQELADRVGRIVRKVDIFGRYGGEEFIVLLPETETENALKVAERIRNIVWKKTFLAGSKDLPVSVSLGIAVRKSQRTGLEELIRHADEAMYQSKRAGRNRVSLFENGK